MLFQTTSAHEELRAKIRSFAEEEIKPLAFLMDQNNEFPEEAVKKLGKLGYLLLKFYSLLVSWGSDPPVSSLRRLTARNASSCFCCKAAS